MEINGDNVLEGSWVDMAVVLKSIYSGLSVAGKTTGMLGRIEGDVALRCVGMAISNIRVAGRDSIERRREEKTREW